MIGISIKSRGAILPSGHRAAGAFWFDDVTGNFVTSLFYMDGLPPWAAGFNGEKLPAKLVTRKWDGFPDWDFQATGGAAPYACHRVGPDAPEVRDMAIRTDRLLGKLFQAIDRSVGMKNVIVVLSADHGVAPTPERDQVTKMPGGYLFADVEDAVTRALNRKFGKASWLIPGAGETTLYFNRETVARARTSGGQRIKEEDLYRAAKEAIFALPLLHVVRVYTREQLENGMAGDFIAKAEANGYFPRRSGDRHLVFEPGYVPGSSGTTHFSPYSYDRQVPVLFMGPGIKAGRYDETIMPNDIAPTLATMLDIQTPSGSSGRVLVEMLGR